MRPHHTKENLNVYQSGFSKNSSYKFGRTELLMLLLLFVAGISVDYWFNHHCVPWQSSNIHPQVSTSVPVFS